MSTTRPLGVLMVAGLAGTGGAAHAGGWDDRFHARGMDGGVDVLALGGSSLFAAGYFSSAGDVLANRIARWDGTGWTALGSGLGDYGFVHAMVWDGANLYVGGDFTVVGGVPAYNITRWDGASWSAVSSGVNGRVFALSWDGTNLYAGGEFTTAGGVLANRIARWDGTRWSPLGSGMDGGVSALAWDGSGLYAGGWFTTAGGVPAARIARWDGTRWSPLGSGMDGGVSALAWDGSGLYAGGGFMTAGGVSAARIARWDGTSWSPLGSGIGGVQPGVSALAWDGSDLYAGGSFTAAGGVLVNKIARWDGTSWSTVGGGASDDVKALASDGANLYAGGRFTSAGGVPASYVARWDGTSWTPTSAGEGVTPIAWVLTYGGSNLYAAGGFTTAGGVRAERIARWDGTRWSPLGSGISGRTGGAKPGVRALAWDGSSLYAGGRFTTAGGVPASCIARWDGTSWSPLGSGMGGAYPSVLVLACDGSNLYAGGVFEYAGGVLANHIARWDGTRWSPLGSGMGGVQPGVGALVWDGSSLYAGGSFEYAGGVAASAIARWDGTSWSPLGSGMSGPSSVSALAWDGSSLYAGGYFLSAGGVPVNHVARWDGTSWSPLGRGMGGLQPGVSALVWNGSSLYAGGWFTTAGEVRANYVARWDGTSWTPLGSGMDLLWGYQGYPFVSGLAWDGSSLYAAGQFRAAGGKPSAYMARWACGTIAITPATLPTATAGLPYTVTFTAGGGASPYTFWVPGGSAPPGLTLSPAGVLAGTPTTFGVFGFTITAADADACTGSVDLVLLVNPPGCIPIALTPSSLPDAQILVGYSQALAAAGGSPPYSFSAAAGALPAGVGLSPAGLLSGTPTESGIFTFSAAATDTAGCTGIQSYALIVSSGKGNVVAGEGLGPSNANRVKVFAGGRPTGTDFFAYGAGAWGVSVAAGDLGADPRRVEQIVTGPGPGPLLGPHARAFVRDGTPVAKVSFYAYGTLRYGVNPGAGALDADSFDEVLTGAGAGAVFGPHVRAFDHDGATLTAIAKVSYFAYGTLRYGVNVHRGDVEGDAYAEILTGPGPGAMFGPQVRGFDYDGASLRSIAKINFDAFGTSGYGVAVAGGSVDLDAFHELACARGPGPSLTPDFSGFGYDASRVTALPGFVLTLSGTTRYGGRAGLGDVTGDAVEELLAGKGRDSGADARVSPFDYATGSLVAMPWFDAFPGASYGVNVAGLGGGF